MHIISNNRKLKEAIKSGRAVFGTVDTWLLHKLKHVNGLEKFEPVTDITNASATGMYDIFAMDWLTLFLKLFKINRNVLPTVVDNSYDFGYTHKSLFGVPIKIATLIADQAASLIGSGCFRKMDAKVMIFNYQEVHVLKKFLCRSLSAPEASCTSTPATSAKVQPTAHIHWLHGT